MKRLLLALLLVPSLAFAAPTGKLLVVRGFDGSYDTETHRVGTESMRRLEWYVTSVLNTLGVNYTVVAPNAVRTEDMKFGTLIHGYVPTTGSSSGFQAGAYAEQFDAILTMNGVVSLHAAGFGAQTTAHRLDSLYRSSRLKYDAATSPHNGLVVPILTVGGDAHAQYLDDGGIYAFRPTLACSVGVASLGSNSSPAFGDIADNQGYRVPGDSRVFFTMGQYQPAVSRATGLSLLCNRGFRTLLTATATSFPYYPEKGVTQPNWADSIWFPNNSDSLVAWDVQFSNISGSAPASFVLIDGPGGADDSASGGQLPGEGDPGILLYSIVHLDSLAGHSLIDWDKMPIQLGVTVDGGFMRTSNRCGPGILPSDSSVFKATLDSLAALNASGGVKIKLAVGVNADSMSDFNLAGGTAYNAYVPELGWWRKLGGNVRFSPQPWRGVKTPVTTTAGDGLASSFSVVDMFGFRRSRAWKGITYADTSADQFIAFGQSGDDTDSDSSWTALMYSARDHMRGAGVRLEEQSHTLLPPLDDWTPTNKSTGTNLDSLALVANLFGYTTIRADMRSPASAIWKAGATSAATWGIAGTGALGYTDQQGVYTTPLGTLKVLGHNGNSIIGGKTMFITIGPDTSRSASGVLPDSGYSNVLYTELTRTASGLLLDQLVNSDYCCNGAPPGFGADPNTVSYYAYVKNNWIDHFDMTYQPRRAAIRKLNVADFSGVPNGPPARWGYWMLKSLKNWFDVTNNAAGSNHTVLQFDYPEDIRVSAK